MVLLTRRKGRLVGRGAIWLPGGAGAIAAGSELCALHTAGVLRSKSCSDGRMLYGSGGDDLSVCLIVPDRIASHWKTPTHEPPPSRVSARNNQRPLTWPRACLASHLSPAPPTFPRGISYGRVTFPSLSLSTMMCSPDPRHGSWEPPVRSPSSCIHLTNEYDQSNFAFLYDHPARRHRRPGNHTNKHTAACVVRVQERGTLVRVVFRSREQGDAWSCMRCEVALMQ